MNASYCKVKFINTSGNNQEMSSNVSSNLALSVIFAVIAMLTFVTNSGLIFAMVYKKLKQNKSTFGPGSVNSNNNKNRITQILMTSLAVSDAFVGSFVMPLAVVEKINNGEWTLGAHWCTARLVIGSILCAVSIYHVVSMAVDRYLAVCKPLVYHRMSSKTGHVMAALCWVIPTILILFDHVIGWRFIDPEFDVGCANQDTVCINVYNKTAFCVNIILYFFIPFAAIFILYFRVLQDILMFNKRKSNRLEKQFAKHCSKLNVFSTKSGKCKHISKIVQFINDTFHMGSLSLKASNIDEDRTSITIISYKVIDTFPGQGQETMLPGRCLEIDKPQQNNNTTQTLQDFLRNDITKTRNGTSNVKAFRTIGFVVACFTVCWLPFCLTSAVIVFSGDDMPSWLNMAISWLGYINSTINPFLFCCNRSVRKSVRQLFNPCQKL